MTTVDPATGRPLPDSAIQRVLFVCPRVHVYQIPPLTSNKGFNAASWTAPPRPTAQQIFTARMRVIETSLNSQIKADIVLEDPATGDLFAAAPYSAPVVVQQALDSSRFFAVRVVGEGGMKATLGLGFEERSEALDFNISLGEVRKVLAVEGGDTAQQGRRGQAASAKPEEPRRDFSLKDGESIHVDIGGRSRKVKDGAQPSDETNSAALFSIRPPPGSAPSGLPALAPPPSAAQVKAKRSPSPAKQPSSQPSAQDLGFDDGEFGEFQ
ncbi:hypothetical protein MBLNU459_g1956t1 [Dothideomycetes sp. NU459]